MSIPLEVYPLDVKQFIVDTLRLPPLAKAAYLMILLDYCATGKAPPNNSTVLGQITGADIHTLDMIAPLFDTDGDSWRHAGIEAEMERKGRVRTVTANASAAAATKRKERKGITQLIAASSPLGMAAVNVEAVKQEMRRLEPVRAAVAAVLAPEPPAPLDHVIPDDFTPDGALVIRCQNIGADSTELAGWFDWFKSYHMEAGTLMPDWSAGFLRYVEKKIAERDAKPKGKPRIELSRRAPAPPAGA